MLVLVQIMINAILVKIQIIFSQMKQNALQPVRLGIHLIPIDVLVKLISNIINWKAWKNEIQDLHGFSLIVHAEGWNTQPTFTKFPIYSLCGSNPVVGGKDKFEDVVAVRKIFNLPTHNKLKIQVDILAIDNWTGSEAIQLLINGTPIKIISPNHNDPAESSFLCGDSEVGDSIHSLLLFLEDSSSQIDLQILQSNPHPTRSFAFSNLKITTKQCSTNCYDCSGPTDTECTSCKVGSYFLNGECLQDCPAGYYKENITLECKLCSPTCGTCSGPDSNECLTCNVTLPYFFSPNSSCLATCPDNYYPNDLPPIPHKTCELCNTTCQNCFGPNADNCLSCPTAFPYFFEANNCCLESCPINFFINQSNFCEACHSTCRSCNGNSEYNCTSCEGLYLYNSTCLVDCPPGYWQNSSNFTCQFCDPTCNECSGPASNECINCLLGGDRWLYQNSCLLECPAGFYQENSTYECLPCNEMCLTCYDSGSSNCLSCNSTLFLGNNTCFAECSDGHYENITLRECVPCEDSFCKSCSAGPDLCDACFSGVERWLYNNTCHYSCPIGTYKDNTTFACEPCDSSCYTCSDSTNTNCTSCQDPLFLYNSTCVPVCPDQFYGDPETRICLPCSDPACEKCPNGIDICEKCISNIGFWLNGTDCVETCPAIRKFHNNDTFTCEDCHPLCYKCSDAGINNCTACEDPLFLYNNTCISTCPDRFYGDPTQRKCVPCTNSACQKCTAAASTCTKCIPNIGFWLSGSNCVSTCPTARKYPNNDTFTCASCHSTCYTCTNGTANDCTSCQSPLFLYNNTCVTTCPDQFYGNTTTRKCEPCTNPDCLKCPTSPSVCDACIPNNGTWLSLNDCVPTCPISLKYPDNNTFVCESCHETCATCTDKGSNNCTSCSAPLFLYDNTCISICPDTFYGDPTTRTCETCTNPYCQKCPNGINKCEQCIPNQGHYLHMSDCITDCPVIKYFTNYTNFSCDACHSTCYTCTGKSSSECTSCISPRYLYNNKCQTSCPDKFHPDVIDRACIPCLDPNCKTCDADQNICEACLASSNKYLFQGVCIPTCHVGYFHNYTARTCDMCHPTCHTCNLTSTNCTSCNGTLYLYQNQCLSVCPAGYFANPLTNTCDKCIINCLECADGTNTQCTVCNNAQNYYIDFGTTCWLQVCGDGRKLGPSEQCDDGNLVIGDGCDSTCQIEPGWYCDPPTAANMTSHCYTICGDGKKVASRENCDDGNNMNEDGCSASCEVEENYFCYDGDPFTPDICTCEPTKGVAAFSQNWEQVLITFRTTLLYVDTTVNNGSPEMCKYLFLNSTISLMGDGYSCKIIGNILQIDLGYYHKFDLNTKIELAQRIFYYIDCPNKDTIFFDTVITSVSPGSYSVAPSCTITGTLAFTPCDPVHLNLIDFKNIGKREVYVHWRVVDMSAPVDMNILNNINQLLDTYTNNQTFSYLVPPLYFLPNNDYTLQITMTPFWGTQGKSEVKLMSRLSFIIRNKDEEEICTPPSQITFTTFPNQRDLILFTFNRRMKTTASELYQALKLEIGPNYNNAKDLDYKFVKIDDYTYQLHLKVKKSIYSNYMQVSVRDALKVVDIYLNPWFGPKTMEFTLLDFDVYTSDQLDYSEHASQAAIAGIISTIIPIVVFGSGPLIVAFLNGAQIINFLRYINIYYPLNVDSFLDTFNNLNYQFMPNFFKTLSDVVESVFVIEDQEAPFRFASLDISSLFIMNAGSIYCLFFLTLAGHGMLKLIYYIPYRKSRIMTFLLRLKSFMEYNAYLILLDSCYYQLGMAIFLQLLNISFLNFWNTSSFFLTIFSLIVYVGFPVFCYAKLNKNYRIYFSRTSLAMKRYGFLLEDLDITTKASRMFFIFILIRKAVYCAILVFLHDWFTVEIFSLMGLNLAYMILIFIVRPFTTAARWKKELLAELFLLLIHLSVWFIKLYESDSNMKYNIGWVVIAGCMSIIGIYLVQGFGAIMIKAKLLFIKLTAKSEKDMVKVIRVKEKMARISNIRLKEPTPRKKSGARRIEKVVIS